MSDAILSNSAYNKLKPITQVWLPASGSLYFGLSQIWGFPGGEEVVGSIALLTTFFGVILGISSKAYKESGAAFDGEVHVNTDENGKTIFSLELDGNPDDIPHQDRLTFKVVGGEPQFWPIAE